MTLLIIALLFGFYAAWNIGANDVANAMGTSVGSRALTLVQAVIIASIFEFSGAVLFGSNVTETLQEGIVAPEFFSNDPMTFIYGMLAALLATGAWLQLASYFGLPVSTTHAICGAIVGFGVVAGGLEAVQWDHVISIALGWIASPLLGGALSYTIFLLIRRKIFYQLHPLDAIKKYFPAIVASVLFVLSMIALNKIILKESLVIIQILISISLAVIFGFIAGAFVKRLNLTPSQVVQTSFDPNLLIEIEKAKKHLSRVQNATTGEVNYQIGDILQEIDTMSYAVRQSAATTTKHTEFYWVEKVFAFLQIISACLMAFAHGSNDVSNAIGPLAAVITTIQSGAVTQHVPLWILMLGGAGIVIGLATWGWRVIDTIGKKITELTPSRGFSSEFGAACTILLASAFGFPVSTTHTLVGAVLGVGLAGGLGALNLLTIRDIIFSWIITIPAGALLSIGSYYVISSIAGAL